MQACGPTDTPGTCACSCRVGEYWCAEDVECDEPGCWHRLLYHLDHCCWFEDNCVCRVAGRTASSPDGYLNDLDMLAMIKRW